MGEKGRTKTPHVEDVQKLARERRLLLYLHLLSLDRTEGKRRSRRDWAKKVSRTPLLPSAELLLRKKGRRGRFVLPSPTYVISSSEEGKKKKKKGGHRWFSNGVPCGLSAKFARKKKKKTLSWQKKVIKEFSRVLPLIHKGKFFKLVPEENGKKKTVGPDPLGKPMRVWGGKGGRKKKSTS